MKFRFSWLSSVLLINIQILQFHNVASDFKLASTDSKNRSSIEKLDSKRRISYNGTRTNVNSIRTRAGIGPSNQEQPCQCVLFYLCDKENVYEPPTPTASIPQCENLQVCCLVPFNINDTLPVEPDTFSTPSTVLPTSTTGFQCVCVPSNRCSSIPDAAVSGAGNIDIRQPGCNSQEVCCPTSDVITIPTRTPTNTPAGDGTATTNQCGRRVESVANRIVSPENLKMTHFGEFPWMALILSSDIGEDGKRRENLFVCGASLLSATVLLTAAHCVNEKSVNELKVRVGDYDTHLGAVNEPLPHQDRVVSRVRIHPNFNSKVLFNDMALLVVDQPFTFAANVAPICFPLLNSVYASQNVYDGSRCVATGWGKEAFGPNAAYQPILKKVDLSIVDRETCQQQLRQTRLGPLFLLDRSFMCAEGQPGTDTCEGDGGGPLICALRNDRTRYVQVGIVSWGIGCAAQIPAVYASLQSNIEWLSNEFASL